MVDNKSQTLITDTVKLPTPPAFDAPLGGPRRISPWGLVCKKTRMVYPTVKKFEDTIVCFDSIHERDRRTETA